MLIAYAEHMKPETRPTLLYHASRPISKYSWTITNLRTPPYHGLGSDNLSKGLNRMTVKKAPLAPTVI
jgi:hypothetical protein